MRKFESAVVHTTFIDESLPDAIKEMAKFIEKVNPSTIDTSLTIVCSYDDKLGYWYVEIPSYYQNTKKLVGMIKKGKEG